MSRVVLVAHGAGSTPDTALRLLAPSLPTAVAAVGIDARGHVDAVVERLDSAARDHDVVLAAGISLGAHAVASWALSGGAPHAILLVMPAWTGAPDDVAAVTRASAYDVATHGSVAVLSRLALDPLLRDDWVLDELAKGWSAYTDEELAAALRAAGMSPAPSLRELAGLTAPAAVVALDDDPLHPAAVARAWAAAIPDSALEVVPRDAPARDRGALGLAGRRALDRLSGSQ